MGHRKEKESEEMEMKILIREGSGGLKKREEQKREERKRERRGEKRENDNGAGTKMWRFKEEERRKRRWT